MIAKKRWLAVSCTTLEALQNCITNQSAAICVEEPLYSQGEKLWSKIKNIANYQITEYSSLHIYILIKVKGSYVFDSEQYQVYHFLLEEI